MIGQVVSEKKSIVNDDNDDANNHDNDDDGTWLSYKLTYAFGSGELKNGYTTCTVLNEDLNGVY